MPRYHISNLTVDCDADWRRELPRQVSRALDGHPVKAHELRLVRRSVDARKRPPKFVYTVELELTNALERLASHISLAQERVPMRVVPGERPLDCPPVIVGAGPAGLMAGLLLAEHGYRPRIWDRGGDVAARQQSLSRFSKTRTPDPECNALFGLGGAGTFSDGKLSTGVRHPWLKEVLRVFVECGAPQDILIDAKPHVGTDVLSFVISELCRRIVRCGGTVETGVRLDDLRNRRDGLFTLDTTAGKVDTRIVMLACGHSARDTWQMLARRGLRIEPKPFQMGIRAEHPQSYIDEQRYGRHVPTTLGAADYKLVGRADDVPVFSFCMCPGGETIPTVNEPQHLCINGMSLHARSSAFASCALVATVEPDAYGGRDLESCLEFQRRVEAACFRAGGEDYSAPAQRLRDFAQGVASASLPKSSYRLGVVPARLDQLLPPIVSNPLRGALRQFESKMRGYLQDSALALGVEARASSPVRIGRDPETLEAIGANGVYPVGEGAGYAGGIMSAALDALNAAALIIERYRPLSA